MGNSNGQQAIAAATTAKVATEVTAAKVSTQQRHQQSMGIESRNGGNGSDRSKRQQWQGGWQWQGGKLDSNGDGQQWKEIATGDSKG